MKMCLYNTYSDNIVGYCKNKQHPYGMTVAQMRCKNCLGKQCKDFVKNESHPYWHQREMLKKKKKQKKIDFDNYIKNLQAQV